MAKESKSGGKYNEDSAYRTMPIGETQLQVLTADSTKAAISKIAQETNKTNKRLLKSIEELSRTVEVLSEASDKVGLDQSYRLLREDLSKIISTPAWNKEGVVKEDKEFFKLLEKFVSGGHITPRKDGREPGKAVEKKDLKSFEDHIARLITDSAFGDNKALPKGAIEGINKEKGETKNLYEWNAGLSEFFTSIGRYDKVEAQRASSDNKFKGYKNTISEMFNKLNGTNEGLEGGFKDTSSPNTAEAVRTLFDRYLNTSIVTQEKQKIVDYAKENPDAMDNDFFLKVAKSSDELSKYLKNPEGGRVREFEKVLKDSVVDVLKGMGAIPLSRGEKGGVKSAPTVVKEIVEKATTTDPSKESSYSSSEKKPQSRKESKGRGAKTELSSDTSPNPAFRDAISKIIAGEQESPIINSIGRVTSQIRDILARREDDVPINQKEMLDRLSKSITDKITDKKKWEPEPEPEPERGRFAESIDHDELREQGVKTELPSDAAPSRPFRDAISKIIAGAGESRGPINSIGRVTSLFPDILARKDDGPKNQKEKIDRIRESITDKKGEPVPEPTLFMDIIKRLNESISNLKTQVWPKDADGQPKNLIKATKDAFDTTSKERDKARDDAPFAKLFEFIDNAKSDPIGTFGAVGKKVTEMLTPEGEESGGIAKGLGAMTSAIGVVIEIIKKIVEASPVLKAVLELFNLAFTLMIMPFGNMIGEWLLPLAMTLIDYAVKFNEIFPKIREVFAGIGEWVLRIPEMIGEKVIELGAKIVEGLTGVKDYIVEKLTDVKDYIFELPGKIIEGVKEAIQKAIAFYTELFGKIKDYILDLPKKIGEKITELKDKIVEKLTNVINRISGLPKKIWESLKGGATHLTTAIKDAVKGFFGKPGEAISGGVDWLAGKLGFAGGGYVPASPGGSIVRVGEGTRGEYIIPEGSSMLGDSGGQTINITFSGNVYGMRDFEDRVTEIVNKTSNKAYYR